MEIKNLLTIVIPCKNEKETILKTLDLLGYQENIKGVSVIICDSSDDSITKESILKRKGDPFNLELIGGGLPSKARNLGFSKVSTPYVLFMDSDIFFIDPKIISECVRKISERDLDLLTIKFRTEDGRFNYIYRIFDIIQIISKFVSPFCLGGFMMMSSQKFNEIGGFDEEIKIAEDYDLSKKIKPNKFGIESHYCFTPARRFDNKGVIYMAKLMIGSFINRNNKSYFGEDKNYWK